MFDTHCHIDFAAFDTGREALWAACQQRGLRHLLVPGVAPSQWATAYKMTQQFSGMLMAAGIHPWWLKDLPESVAERDVLISWQDYLARSACAAVGECGLDKTLSISLALQQQVFEQHLRFACDFNLPVVIHVRKAHSETLALLRRFRPSAGGVIHGFSGSVELAERYWALGFYLGVGGTITYARARKTRNTLACVPLEALVLETDAPDMPLEGFQGQFNSPLQLPLVAEALADLRGQPVTLIAEQTTANSCRLFGL
ncbi:MAG: TatD family hydrolase [Cellvibrionaceae bacterium]|nr:TatD family hydrolase [Cellvibrionaceae bacterium]